MRRGQSVSYVDEAYAYVKSLIFEGSVKPGGRVGIEDVMTHLGVSRQPVRDAINRLATAGFVTVIPQVGCVVPKIDPGEASDFFEIFRVVEGRMAAFAAERHTPAQLERALEISAGIERLLEADAIDSAEVERRFRASSRELHTAIHAMAASPTIERIAESLLDRFDYYLVRHPRLPISAGGRATRTRRGDGCARRSRRAAGDRGNGTPHRMCRSADFEDGSGRGKHAGRWESFLDKARPAWYVTYLRTRSARVNGLAIFLSRAS
jgi:DNA-binding GntR family transcriptional regulator